MSKIIITNLITKFILNIKEKYKDEQTVVNIILEVIKTKYFEYYKLFFKINIKDIIEVQNYYTTNSKDNNNKNIHSKIKKIFPILKHDHSEISSHHNINVDNHKEISNSDKNKLNFYDVNFHKKLFEIFKHSSKNLYNNHNYSKITENIIFSESFIDDIAENYKVFIRKNNSKSKLLINITQMTLFLLTQTNQIQINKEEKYENIFYQKDINYIINSGQGIRQIRLIKFYIFKLFSKKQNIFQQKIQCFFLTHSSIIFDKRQYESSSVINKMFNIVEIPLAYCSLYALAIKDINIFKKFLTQNQCSETVIDNFLKLYDQNPCSIYVQYPLFNQFDQLIKQRVNLELFQQNERKSLIKYIQDKYIYKMDNASKYAFREVFTFRQQISVDLKTTHYKKGYRNIDETDEILRFLEHIENFDLVQSIDTNETKKLRKKFMKEKIGKKIVGYDINQLGEIYKRVFGKCIILSGKMDKSNYKDIDNQMQTLRDDFSEMKSENQLFMPQCFQLRYLPGMNQITLQGGLRSYKDELNFTYMRNGYCIKKIKYTDQDTHIDFTSLFKQFLLNAMKSSQFSKDELIEIKNLIKSIEGINNTFISLACWQEFRPDYINKLSDKAKFLEHNQICRKTDEKIKRI